jgi:hypothetical protein
VNAASNYVYQHIDSMDDFLNITQSTLGSGVIETAAYNEPSGLVDHITAKKGGLFLMAKLSFLKICSSETFLKAASGAKNVWNCLADC